MGHLAGEEALMQNQVYRMFGGLKFRQVGVFTSEDKARELAARLRLERSSKARVTHDGDHWLVWER